MFYANGAAGPDADRWRADLRRRPLTWLPLSTASFDCRGQQSEGRGAKRSWAKLRRHSAALASCDLPVSPPRWRSFFHQAGFSAGADDLSAVRSTCKLANSPHHHADAVPWPLSAHLGWTLRSNRALRCWTAVSGEWDVVSRESVRSAAQTRWSSDSITNLTRSTLGPNTLQG